MEFRDHKTIIKTLAEKDFELLQNGGVHRKEMTSVDKKKIIMLNTQAKGGMSSVIGVYKEVGLFERYPIELITTHTSGPLVLRLWVMSRAFVFFVFNIICGRCAIVHAHIASYGSFWRKSLFLVVSYVLGIPSIIHLHGSEFQMFYSGSNWLSRNMVRIIFNKATVVIALSKSWSEWISTISKNRNIYVIYNSVPLPSQVCRENRDHNTILFLGVVGKRKGSYDLIEAFSRITKTNPEVKLLIGGDGEIEELADRARVLGCYQNVEFLGWVTGEQKRNLLKTAGIFCLPSYNEGLPMSVLEAMSYGMPTISTRIAALPEAITDGVEGFLIEPGNLESLTSRLQLLIADRRLAKAMGDAAIQKVREKFSAESVVPQLEKVYALLGAKHRSGSSGFTC